jgi:GT2 family glycosyltransferase
MGLNRIMLQAPRRLTVYSQWQEHIPFAMLAVDLCRPRMIVELGTFSGDSYCSFCQAVQELELPARCYAVDTWEGDPQGGFYGPEILADLRAHHDDAYGGFSTLMKATFDEALEHFEDGSIDLLHIDGYHTYEAVRHDFDGWLPKVSDRGVVLFHDTNERGGDFGVWRFWEEVSAQYPNLSFEHGHGLGVLAVGEEPPAFKEFRLQFEKDPASTRQLFFGLGRKLRLEVDIRLERERRRGLEEALANLQASHDDVVSSFDARVAAHKQLLEEEALQSEQAWAARLARYRAAADDREAALRAELAAVRRQVDPLVFEVAARERDLAAVRAEATRLTEEISRIESSLGWHLVSQYRSAVHKVAPKDSLRAHAYSAAVHAARPQRRAGPPPPAPASVGPRTPTLGPARVSVVIPVHNNRAVTEACIDSIYAAAGAVSFEVVVVNNGSDASTTAWLETQVGARPNFVLVNNAVNLGFPRAVNQGCLAARGQYIALCNNDILVPPGWLEALAGVLDTHPEIAIVSPVTNSVGEGPQPQRDEGGVETLANQTNERAAAVARTGDELRRVPDRLVFFCVLLRASLYKMLGGLAEDFGMGNFEDDDFCVRARMLGAELAVDPTTFVFHHGSNTWKIASLSHDEWMGRNRGIYFRKLATYATDLSMARPSLHAAAPVSVIVRTQRRPRLLAEALASLANQTFKDFEVVVVNDGGDDVSALLDRLAPYLNIRYLRHTKAKGRTPALNAGIDAARGAWLTYLDDDDIVYPSHLELLYSAADEEHDVVYSHMNKALRWVHENGDEQLLALEPFGVFDFSSRELLVQNHLPIQSLLHTAKALADVGGFDETMDVLEDWDLLMRLAQDYPFRRVPKFTGEYRFRISARGLHNDILDREKSYEAQKLLFSRYPVEDYDLKFRREEISRLTWDQAQRVAHIHATDLSDGEKGLRIAAECLGLRGLVIPSRTG